MPKQGLDFVIKRIPEIIEKLPGFKFKIIGGGNYKSHLVQMVNDLSLERRCEFLGRIENLE